MILLAVLFLQRELYASFFLDPTIFLCQEIKDYYCVSAAIMVMGHKLAVTKCLINTWITKRIDYYCKMLLCLCLRELTVLNSRRISCWPFTALSSALDQAEPSKYMQVNLRSKEILWLPIFLKLGKYPCIRSYFVPNGEW